MFVIQRANEFDASEIERLLQFKWVGPRYTPRSFLRARHDFVERKSRTPGLSSGEPMNSMPAASKALCKANKVWLRLVGTPSICSSRFIVGRLTPDRFETSCPVQRSKARAALIWLAVIILRS